MVKKLLEQARLLPRDQRAELALQVLRSLDGDHDVAEPEWARRWTDELARRRREIAEGGRQEAVEGLVIALRAKRAARG